MNVIKISDSMLKISTIAEVKEEFIKTSDLLNSYKKKEHKIVSPLVEKINEVDPNLGLCESEAGIVCIEFMSKEIPLDTVEIALGGNDFDKINNLITMQKEIVEALLLKEATSSIIDRINKNAHDVFDGE
jgi:hypothetical protein